MLKTCSWNEFIGIGNNEKFILKTAKVQLMWDEKFMANSNQAFQRYKYY